MNLELVEAPPARTCLRIHGTDPVACAKGYRAELGDARCTIGALAAAARREAAR